MDEKRISDETEIKIIENGPMLIEGEFEFINSKGEKQYLGKKVYLCRCGNSGNMPFCDRTHKKNCFT